MVRVEAGSRFEQLRWSPHRFIQSGYSDRRRWLRRRLSTIALARAYPQARLVGVDIDPPTIDMARAAAYEAGVADRVTFQIAEGESLSEDAQFDAVRVRMPA